MRHPASATAAPAVSPRFASVDVLRGLAVAAMLVVNDAGDWSHVYAWVEHAEWNGCTAADLVFPTFLFVVGASLALATRAASAPERRARIAAAGWRALRILLLGFALNLIAEWTIPGRAFRIAGVLQRIAVCYAVVAAAALYLAPRTQWFLAAGLLAGYGVLLALGGPLQPGLTIVDRVDTRVLGRFAYAFDPATGQAHDPEGLLSTLPAIATTLLGLRAGAWLAQGRTRTLAMAAAIAAAAGLALSTLQPINKSLWTPAFVFWSGGCAGAALALLHVLVDRHGLPLPGRSLGVNAILAYAAAWVAACLLAIGGAQAWVYGALFAAPLAASDPRLPSFLYALAFTGACWLALHALARRGIRVTI